MKDTDNTIEQLIQERELLQLRIKQLELEQDSSSYYDDLHIGINNVDIMGNFTYVNKRFLEVSGYSKEEIIGKNAFKIGIFPRDSLKIILKRMKDRLRGEPSRYLELQCKHKDGRLIWVELAGRLMKTHGVPVGFQISTRDITDRKKAEKALQESEEKYRTMVESINDVIFTTDDQGIVTYISPVMEQLTAYKTTEIIGKPFQSFIFQDDLPELVNRFVDIMDGKIELFEFRIVNKDGKIMNVRSFIRPVVKDGKSIGVTGVLADITGLMKAEVDLHNSVERFNQVAEVADEFIWEVDEKGVYSYCSPAVERILGYSAGELVGQKHFYDLFAQEVRDELKEQVLAAFERKQSILNFVNPNIHKNGRMVYLETNGLPMLDEKGNLLGYRGVDKDISERKRAEEEINRSSDTQAVLKKLLQLSLEDLSTNELLARAIDLILSVTWLTLKNQCGIFLVEDEKFLVLVVQKGLDKPIQEACARIPFGKCLYGQAALAQEIQFADHIDKHHAIQYDGMIPHGHYCVPILYAGKTLGVINVYLKEGRSSKQSEKDFLIAIANTLAGIIVRKQAEEILRRSEKNFRSSIDNSPLGILIVSSDIPEVSFLYSNQAFLDIYGYSSLQEYKTIRPEQRFTPQGYIGYMERREKRLRGEPVPDSYETSIVRKDGAVRYLQLLIKEVIWEGKKQNQLIHIDITERKQADENLRQSNIKLQETLDSAVTSIAYIAETRDPYTAGHQVRVSALACAIAEEMGLSGKRIADIKTGGLLHDIGKLIVPAEILSRPGKLNDNEFSLIKQHPKVGYDIVKKIEFPCQVAQIVIQHHERIDGSGYPGGLRGDDITIEAKIIAVADVVEAMSSHRPYRPALGIEKALEEICKNAGTLYDTTVGNACLKLFNEKGFKFEG